MDVPLAYTNQHGSHEHGLTLLGVFAMHVSEMVLTYFSTLCFVSSLENSSVIIATMY